MSTSFETDVYQLKAELGSIGYNVDVSDAAYLDTIDTEIKSMALKIYDADVFELGMAMGSISTDRDDIANQCECFSIDAPDEDSFCLIVFPDKESK